MEINFKSLIHTRLLDQTLTGSGKLKVFIGKLNAQAQIYSNVLLNIAEAIASGNVDKVNHGVVSWTEDADEGSVYVYTCTIYDLVNALINSEDNVEDVSCVKFGNSSGAEEISIPAEYAFTKISQCAFSVECVLSAIAASASGLTSLSDIITAFREGLSVSIDKLEDSVMIDVYEYTKRVIVDAFSSGMDIITVILSRSFMTATSEEADENISNFYSDYSAFTGVSPFSMWFSSFIDNIAEFIFLPVLTAAKHIFNTTFSSAMYAMVMAGYKYSQFINSAYKAIELAFHGTNLARADSWDDMSVDPGVISWRVDPETPLFTLINEIMGPSVENQIVSIPTIGCTLYAFRKYEEISVGYKPHLYEQVFSESLLQIISRTGNDFDSIFDQIQNLTNPNYLPYNDNDGSPVRNINTKNAKSLMMTQRLIPFGLLLLDSSVNSVSNRYYQDASDTSFYRDLFVYYKNQAEYDDVTLWNNLRMITAVNELPNANVSTIKRLVETAIESVLGDNNAATGAQVNGFQYALISEPLISAYTIPTDKDNATIAAAALKKIGRVVAVVAVAVVIFIVITKFVKLKGVARKAAGSYMALALSASSTPAQVNRAYRKAKVLSILTGTSLNGSTLSLSGLFGSVNKVNESINTDTDIARDILSESRGIQTEVNKVLTRIG